jgi:DNA-binding MarR family transcriptional regulator
MSDLEKRILTPLTPADGPDFRLIELFFFAYRDFIADADEILETYDFGRAHHRVLHFVNRDPGLKVAELLDILKITKQSLARVLRQLIESGHIDQQVGRRDRRQRLLYPTLKGRELALKLSELQSKRIETALQKVGIENREFAENFLKNLIGIESLTVVEHLQKL